MKRESETKATTTKSTRKKTELPTLDIQREVKPTMDDIRRRAYEIYLGRMHRGEPGSPETDWSFAEKELLNF